MTNFVVLIDAENMQAAIATELLELKKAGKNYAAKRKSAWSKLPLFQTSFYMAGT